MTKDDLMVHEMKYDENGLDLSLSGDSAKFFMATLIQFFEQNGGENFLTMALSNRDKKYEITIVNQNGNDTPSEKLERLQREIEELQSELTACGELYEKKHQWASFLNDQMKQYKKALEEIVEHSEVSYQGEIAKKALGSSQGE